MNRRPIAVALVWLAGCAAQATAAPATPPTAETEGTEVTTTAPATPADAGPAADVADTEAARACLARILGLTRVDVPRSLDLERDTCPADPLSYVPFSLGSQSGPARQLDPVDPGPWPMMQLLERYPRGDPRRERLLIEVAEAFDRFTAVPSRAEVELELARATTTAQREEIACRIADQQRDEHDALENEVRYWELLIEEFPQTVNAEGALAALAYAAWTLGDLARSLAALTRLVDEYAPSFLAVDAALLIGAEREALDQLERAAESYASARTLADQLGVEGPEVALSRARASWMAVRLAQRRGAPTGPLLVQLTADSESTPLAPWATCARAQLATE